MVLHLDVESWCGDVEFKDHHCRGTLVTDEVCRRECEAHRYAFLNHVVGFHQGFVAAHPTMLCVDSSEHCRDVAAEPLILGRPNMARKRGCSESEHVGHGATTGAGGGAPVKREVVAHTKTQ